MFGLRSFFTRQRQHPASASPRRPPLMLERLETRDCPSAPGLTMSVQIIGERNVYIYGQVTDEHPELAVVQILGQVTATAAVDSNGEYSFQGEADGLGAVSAQAFDDECLASPIVSETLTSNVPSLTLALAYYTHNGVILTGQVTDEDPSDRLIQFMGGVDDAVYTNWDGSFELWAEGISLDDVSAIVQDPWGQNSNQPSVALYSDVPVITSFTAIRNSTYVWTLSGTVDDEDPWGLMVQFGDLASLAGQTAVVQEDGSFSLTVTLEPGEAGMAWAQVTDWWFQDSAEAWEMVF